MRAALLPPPEPLARLLEDGPLAVFLDFDGTLVDLAPSPDAITPHPQLAEQLEALSAKLEGRLAIVSGRSLDDIARHLGPLTIAGAGSHGADRRGADGAVLGEAADVLSPSVLEAMQAYAERHALGFEAKPHGAALHYRKAPELEEAACDFAQALAHSEGLRVQNGKCVVEICAQKANKGDAVRLFMQEQPFKGAKPVFIGDDLTDEEGFAAACALGGSGVIVGERAGTKADFALRDVESVHQWLGLAPRQADKKWEGAR